VATVASSGLLALNDAVLLLPVTVSQDVNVAVVGSGHSGANYVNTTLVDEVAAALPANAAPYTGSFKPDAALTPFDGNAAEGAWTLEVSDVTMNKTGTLDSWSVSVRYTDCDYDGDGLNDEADNCPDNANAAQVDTDGDHTGDACDTDDDDFILDATTTATPRTRSRSTPTTTGTATRARTTTTTTRRWTASTSAGSCTAGRRPAAARARRGP